MTDLVDIPRIDPVYELADAAKLLAVSVQFLRKQLRNNVFAGYKPAGRWYMLESQIVAAQQQGCTEVRAVEPPNPSGLSRRSRLYRRNPQLNAAGAAR